MKKPFIILILVILSLNSCHLSKYTLETRTPSYVDFRTGKWLLNDIQSSSRIKSILKKIAVENFEHFLKERLFDLSETNGIIVPKFIPLNPNKALLKDLKNGTAFDYFINIKSNSIKNELGSTQFGDNEDNDMNEGTITVEIYDLNTLQIIFRQKCFGSNGTKLFTKDFSFAKDANNLIIGGLEKIMKELKKNSKY